MIRPTLASVSPHVGGARGKVNGASPRPKPRHQLPELVPYAFASSGSCDIRSDCKIQGQGTGFYIHRRRLVKSEDRARFRHQHTRKNKRRNDVSDEQRHHPACKRSGYGVQWGIRSRLNTLEEPTKTRLEILRPYTWQSLHKSMRGIEDQRILEVYIGSEGQQCCPSGDQLLERILKRCNEPWNAKSHWP